MNQERIIRVMLEEINGVWQGACIPFVDKRGLRKGNNRLAFSPDGSLYVGQVQHGFVGDTGIQRIVFTGKPPVDIYSMRITDEVALDSAQEAAGQLRYEIVDGNTYVYGDINGDGRADILNAYGGWEQPASPGRVTALLPIPKGSGRPLQHLHRYASK